MYCSLSKMDLFRSCWVCLLLFATQKISTRAIYRNILEKRFSADFLEKCYFNHAWVRDYVGKFRKENHFFLGNRTYAIFIYDDNFIRARKGGLGDRLGGIITAFIWALRKNRNLLIESKLKMVCRLYFNHYDSEIFRIYSNKLQKPPIRYAEYCTTAHSLINIPLILFYLFLQELNFQYR